MSDNPRQHIEYDEAGQVIARIDERAIASDSDMLITGETGTGKERVARAIHDKSPRKDNPLFAINCGTVLKEAFFSELLGATKGRLRELLNLDMYAFRIGGI